MGLLGSTGWHEPERRTLPVDGGELAVGRWGTVSQVVVACHGITASRPHHIQSDVVRSLADAGPSGHTE